MDRREFNLLLSAAVGGMITGACGGDTTSAPAPEKPAADPAHAATEKSDGKGDATAEKSGHPCAGKNECKGKGGCKTASHDCAGKNECKGKGGCATGDYSHH